MKSAAKTVVAEDNFAGLARTALETTDGTAAQAVPCFVGYLMADRALLERNLETILTAFANGHITTALKNRRQEQPNLMPVRLAAVDGAALRAAVMSNYDRYMSRPIWGGKAIKDATAAEIRESAARYIAQAATMSRESAWQTSVAETLEQSAGGAGATVRDCLSEATLAKLWEATSGGED